MKTKLRTIPLSKLFAYLLIIIGVGLSLIAVLTAFGQAISAEAVAAGVVLVGAGMAFLQAIDFRVSLCLTGLVTLGTGYAVLIETNQNWWATIIVAILVAMLFFYFFGVRKNIHRSHSSWYK